jgi:hypothetical protein
MNVAGHHLSLAVSNSRLTTPDRRTACLAQAYACADMALRADNAEDKKALRGMTTVWMILAQRDAPARAAAKPIPIRAQSRRERRPT